MLFSAPEGALKQPATASPPPATNPFQAPDFGEDDTFEGDHPAAFPTDDAHASASDARPAARRRAS